MVCVLGMLYQDDGWSTIISKDFANGIFLFVDEVKRFFVQVKNGFYYY